MRRVVLVEDYTDIAALIAVVLSGHHKLVALFTSAIDAQNFDGWHRVDVVVTDHQLPTMTGGTLLDWLAANQPQLGRVMISAQDPPQSIRGKADVFIDKQDLYEKLNEAIEQAAR